MNFTKSRAKAALINYEESANESDEAAEKRKKKKKKSWVDEVDTDDWSTYESQDAIGVN